MSARVAEHLTAVALGGLGEVGMNCLVLEQHATDGPERLLIDCGAAFPDGVLGEEIIYPCFDHLLDGVPIAGVVVTHGHEDHVGALGGLFRALNDAGVTLPPVRGPAYALALARGRFEEAGVELDDLDLAATTPGEPYALGGFSIESIRVTHSIQDATAVAVRCAAGLLVHTGDFKIDPAPADGEYFDAARLESLGDEGVDLLMSDSTGALSEGHTRSEGELRPALEAVIADAPGRVVVGLFGSNLHRMDAVVEIAARARRRVCLLGRSVRRHADLGRSLGRVDWPSDRLVAPEIARSLGRDRVLYLATGTQAEPRGALRRLASAQHPAVRLEAGDRVVLSSRIIPGQERPVLDMVDAFTRMGVEVRTPRTDPGVHASGHARRDELARMIELTRPRAFVPVHGSRALLEGHAALARDWGVTEVLIAEDGERFRFDGERLAPCDRVPAGPVPYAHGAPLPAALLRDRRRLARAGVAVVTLLVDEANRLETLDFRLVAVSSRVDVDEARRRARSTYEADPGPGAAARVRRALVRFFASSLGRAPTVDVALVPKASSS